jgi:hypothetical protein
MTASARLECAEPPAAVLYRGPLAEGEGYESAEPYAESAAAAPWRPGRTGSTGTQGSPRTPRGRSPWRASSRLARAGTAARSYRSTVPGVISRHEAPRIRDDVRPGGIGAALAIGATAGLYPSMRAAHLSPTEALRTVWAITWTDCPSWVGRSNPPPHRPALRSLGGSDPAEGPAAWRPGDRAGHPGHLLVPGMRRTRYPRQPV